MRLFQMWDAAPRSHLRCWWIPLSFPSPGWVTPTWGWKTTTWRSSTRTTRSRGWLFRRLDDFSVWKRYEKVWGMDVGSEILIMSEDVFFWRATELKLRSVGSLRGSEHSVHHSQQQPVNSDLFKEAWGQRGGAKTEEATNRITLVKSKWKSSIKPIRQSCTFLPQWGWGERNLNYSPEKRAMPALLESKKQISVKKKKTNKQHCRSH